MICLCNISWRSKPAELHREQTSRYSSQAKRSRAHRLWDVICEHKYVQLLFEWFCYEPPEVANKKFWEAEIR